MRPHKVAQPNVLLMPHPWPPIIMLVLAQLAIFVSGALLYSALSRVSAGQIENQRHFMAIIWWYFAAFTTAGFAIASPVVIILTWVRQTKRAWQLATVFPVIGVLQVALCMLAFGDPGWGYIRMLPFPIFFTIASGTWAAICLYQHDQGERFTTSLLED